MKFIILFSTLFLASCASNPTAENIGTSLIEADSKMIASCDFIGTFASRSLWGGLASGYSERKSLANAKVQAAAKGATHFITGDVVAANFQHGSRVSIKGYRCK